MSGCNEISSLNKAAGGKRSLTPLCYQIQLRRRRKPFLLYEAVVFDKNDYNRRLIYFERQLPSSFIHRQVQTTMTFLHAHLISFSLLESLSLLAWTSLMPAWIWIWISWLTLTCLLCFTFFYSIKKGAGFTFLRHTLFRQLDCNRRRAWRRKFPINCIQKCFFFLSEVCVFTEI